MLSRTSSSSASSFTPILADSWVDCAESGFQGDDELVEFIGYTAATTVTEAENAYDKIEVPTRPARWRGRRER